MPVDTVAAGLLIAATAGLLFSLVLVAFRARLPGTPGGVLVKVDCPEDHKAAEVRIGKDEAGVLGVLWCDRFVDRPVGCRQACFIHLPGGNGDAKAAAQR